MIDASVVLYAVILSLCILFLYVFNHKKEATELKFAKLKHDIGRCYEGEGYRWLRFCTFDLLNVSDITHPRYIGNDLFNILEENGLITHTNVNLLLDITILTEVKEAEDLVRRYMTENRVQNNNKTRLSLYRKELFKAIRNIPSEDLPNFNAYYKLSRQNFRNIWDLVLKLEIEKKLEDEPDKIKCFSQLSNGIVKQILDDYVSKTGDWTFIVRNKVITLGFGIYNYCNGIFEALLILLVVVLLTYKLTLQDEEIREYLTAKQKNIFNNPLIRPPTWRGDCKYDTSLMFTDPVLSTTTANRHRKKLTTFQELLAIIKSRDPCKILITGNGGMGKTTLLQYISYTWAVDSDAMFAGKILFLVNVRDIEKGQTITDIIVNTVQLRKQNDGPFYTNGNIKTFIEKYDKELIILIDGLDELKSGVDIPLILKNEELEGSTVILTSRPGFNSLETYYHVHVKVEGFDTQKIKKYIIRYFEYIEKPGLGQLLISKINNSKDQKNIFELFSSPFLLLKLCTLWQEKQQIPNDFQDFLKEVFRSIINQYINRGDGSTPYETFKDIPTDYKNAIVKLGKMSYIGLQKNVLNFTDKLLNELMGQKTLNLLLKIGFLYKEDPIVQDNFTDTYRCPHKLWSEALAAFYLSKAIETLDSEECEKIRTNMYLHMTRVFTISFLGPDADKILVHWLKNRASNYYSLSKYFKYVNQEHEEQVVKSLIRTTEIKEHVQTLTNSFKTFLFGKNLHLIQLLKLFSDDLSKNLIMVINNLVSFINEPNEHSQEDVCRIVAHLSIILQLYKAEHKHILSIHDTYLIKLLEKWGDRALEILSNEFKKYHVSEEIFSFIFVEDDENFKKRHIDGTQMCRLFQNFPNLEALHFNLSWGSTGALHSPRIDTMVKECKHNKTFAKLKTFSLPFQNLYSINGASLGHILSVSRNLENFNLTHCRLTSKHAVDMLDEVDIDYIKSKENIINLELNDLSNIDRDSLANLINALKVSDSKEPKLSWVRYNLSAKELHNLLISPSRYRFRWDILILDGIDLSSIKGSTLANIFIIFPNLVRLSMNDCNLNGTIVNDMLSECYKNNIINKGDLKSLKGNDLIHIQDNAIIPLFVFRKNNNNVTLEIDIIAAYKDLLNSFLITITGFNTLIIYLLYDKVCISGSFAIRLLLLCVCLPGVILGLML